MSNATQSESLEMPSSSDLPLFVYGALKPGLPGFEKLRQWVACFEADSVAGNLYVHDGLPRINPTQ